MKPVFWLDSRLKCLRQSTIVSINNSLERQRKRFSYKAAELSPSKIISSLVKPKPISWELPSLCHVWMQTEHLDKAVGQVVVFPVPQVTGCNGLSPGREGAGPLSLRWADVPQHSGLLLSGCVATGQHLPCQGSWDLLPRGFVTSCPAEGVLKAGVARLEDARRRVAEEGSRGGGVGRWLSTA